MSIVFLVDTDFLIDRHHRNYLLMRVSSYHKQLGDTVHLVRDVKELKQKHQLVYFMADVLSPTISAQAMMGNGVYTYHIPFMRDWVPPAAVLACRPDYNLYEPTAGFWANAIAIQLSDDRGHILRLRQRADNAYEKNQPVLVTDMNLWILPTSELVEALNSLPRTKTIGFLAPVSARRIASDQSVKEAFLALKTRTKHRTLLWERDLRFTRENVDLATSLAMDYEPANGIEFAQMHFSRPLDDIMLCMYLAGENKRKGTHVSLAPLVNRGESAYIGHYLLMYGWLKNIEQSYFEYIGRIGAEAIGLDDYRELYAHPEWWTNTTFKLGLDWARTYLHHGGLTVDLMRTWNGKILSSTIFNWKALALDDYWI